MRIPIRARLALTFTAILLVVIASLELASYAAVRSAVLNVVDRELDTRLAGVEDHIDRHVGRFGWPKTADDIAVHPAFHPALLLIQSDTGDVLLKGSALDGIRLPTAGGLATLDGPRDALRFLLVRHKIHGAVYSIALGTDLQFQSSFLRRLWLILLLSVPLMLTISAAAGYRMSGRALAPIQEMMTAARSIDSRRLGQRVPVPQTGDEVQQLAEAFNGTLERIEAGFQKMREFTANASHELRTPVAIVRAAAEIALLRPRASEAHYRETLERILRESERNTVLLENMLELARADAGTNAGQREWVSLNRSLEEATAQVLPLATAKNISVRFHSSAENPTVLADSDQLRRLWLILLDNAIKYTPPGGSVTATARVTAQGGTVGEVIDTGMGISSEQTELVFERFYRADKARSRSMGGAGLGLSIAREIALIHEADIQVESELHGGSRFFVTFPKPAAPAISSKKQTTVQTLR